MDEPVRIYIERVKAAFGVKTDDETAKVLGISKQAIANWRRRNKIPKDIELRIINLFGPEFATSDYYKAVFLSRENDVVYAATLYAYFKFKDVFSRDFANTELMELGTYFCLIEKAIRKKVREIGFFYNSSNEILQLMMASIDKNEIPEIWYSLDPSTFDLTEY